MGAHRLHDAGHGHDGEAETDGEDPEDRRLRRSAGQRRSDHQHGSGNGDRGRRHGPPPHPGEHGPQEKQSRKAEHQETRGERPHEHVDDAGKHAEPDGQPFGPHEVRGSRILAATDGISTDQLDLGEQHERNRQRVPLNYAGGALGHEQERGSTDRGRRHREDLATSPHDADKRRLDPHHQQHCSDGAQVIEQLQRRRCSRDRRHGDEAPDGQGPSRHVFATPTEHEENERAGGRDDEVGDNEGAWPPADAVQQSEDGQFERAQRRHPQDDLVLGVRNSRQGPGHERSTARNGSCPERALRCVGEGDDCAHQVGEADETPDIRGRPLDQRATPHCFSGEEGEATTEPGRHQNRCTEFEAGKDGEHGPAHARDDDGDVPGDLLEGAPGHLRGHSKQRDTDGRRGEQQCRPLTRTRDEHRQRRVPDTKPGEEHPRCHRVLADPGSRSDDGHGQP